MSTDVSGLGVSRLLLVGALALAPVMQAGAASAVTLAFYESGWSMNFRVTGARDMDGEPVGTGAIRTEADVFGGDNDQELYVLDADGNDIYPTDGIAEVGIFSGSLFDAAYDVYMASYIFAYGEIYRFENVSDVALHAAFSLDRSVEAEAFSIVPGAISSASGFGEGADLYFDTAAEDWRPEDRMSPEAIDALTSDLFAAASSDGETSVSERITHDFEVLLYPGDTFNVDYFFMSTDGFLENTPAPVPLPAGAPLLLAALGGLAVARRWRNPAR